MSDETPRTDAILTEWLPKITAADGDAECKAVILGFVRVLGYHARDLECELAAMTAERDGWKIACEAAQKVARDNEAENAAMRVDLDAAVKWIFDVGVEMESGDDRNVTMAAIRAVNAAATHLERELAAMTAERESAFAALARCISTGEQSPEVDARIYAGIMRIRGDRDEARALLREVYDYLESLKFTPNPNAPGHRHNIPGRWDGDGAACTWCATWSRVRACVQQPDIHHRGTEGTENG